MATTEGWAKLEEGLRSHYFSLDCIGGCGIYRSLCGEQGWVARFQEPREVRVWCERCAQHLDFKQEPVTSFGFEESTRLLPPSQIKAKRWPVLHLGSVPNDNAFLSIDGLIGRPRAFTLEALCVLPQVGLVADMHCVMRWTVEGIKWRGVSMKAIFDQVKPWSKFVLAHGANDYFTNLTIEDAAKGLIAMKANGKPLEPEHGGPLRLVIPHLYAWKSVKWLQRLEFVNADQPGTWEQRGLHNRGDVWTEERFAKTSV